MDYGLLESAVRNARGFCEVRAVSSESRAFSLKDGMFSSTAGSSSSCSARASSKGGPALAWGPPETANELVARADALANSRGRGKKETEKPETASVGKEHELPDSQWAKDALISAQKAAFSGNVKNCTLGLRASSVRRLYLSSDGARIEEKAFYAYFSALAIAKDGTAMQRGVERTCSRAGFEGMDLEKCARDAGECANRMLTASPPPKGRMPVIMDPEMTGVFSHEAVGHASEADSIVERESIFRGKLGKKIGSELVSITDDPAFDGFGQYFYDDEGFRGTAAPLVKNGVLCGYINARESAETLNMPRNGHARAQGPEHLPIVRMSNTLFQRGEHSESDVFDVKDGVYAIGMKGGSVDIFSGNFMFAATEARIVKNGSIEGNLRDLTVSGNLLQALAGVEKVGKDYGTSPGFCGKAGQSAPVADGGPHVRIREMRVG
jgi:TldD protein